MPFCKDSAGDSGENKFVAVLTSGSMEKFQIDCQNAVGYLAVYR